MTTTETTPDVVLDWNKMGYAPTVHDCDCEHCEVQGEVEHHGFPPLVQTVLADGITYITNRFVLVRADRAPIPSDYKGGTIVKDLPLREWPTATDRPAHVATVFGDYACRMIERASWKLHVCEHADDADEGRRRIHAVMDEHGEHIGWAIASRTHESVVR